MLCGSVLWGLPGRYAVQFAEAVMASNVVADNNAVNANIR